MTTTQRLKAVLGLRKTNIPHLIRLATLIYTNMLANATMFVSPPVTMAALLLLIEALQSAQTAVATAKNLAPARDLKRDALVTALEQLQSFVQTICDGNTAQAATVINAAGMKIRTVAVKIKPLIVIKLTVASGGVILKAHASALRAGKKSKSVLYNWQSTGDGGKTIANAPPSSVANTTMTGLTPNVEYGFRVSITDSTGQGPWTDWFHGTPR
jgi:hypothetical protein